MTEPYRESHEVAIAELRRDVADVREEVAAVDARAGQAASFVRRVLLAAGGVILAGVGSAVGMIYSAGERSANTRADAAAARAEVMEHVHILEDGLTDLRSQVKLLLKKDLNQ